MTQAEVLELLKNMKGNSLTVAQIAQLLGLSTSSVGHSVRKLSNNYINKKQFFKNCFIYSYNKKGN